MTGTTVTLRRADEDALPEAEALLDGSGLPTDDLRSGAVRLYVAETDTRSVGGSVGVGGLERHGDAALLRSVAVAPEHRAEGYGTAIVDALESEARAAGVDGLYLLTTTASDFFAARGYDELDRADVPEPIRDTAQFTDLCPSSATAMGKSL